MRTHIYLLLLASLMALSACADANQSVDQDELATAVECSYPMEGTPAKAVDPPPETGIVSTGEIAVTLHFTAGDVTLTLDREKTPCTVNSFLALAEQGYFNDTSCHRLVNYGLFILQCGDPTATGTGGPGYTVPSEVTGDETYPRGTVAMANRGGDAATGGSQFFLVWGDTELDPDYTVFGKMDEDGVSVIAGIAEQGVAAEDGKTPIAEAKITSVSLS